MGREVKLTDAEHDAFVKAADAGDREKMSRLAAPIGRKRLPRLSSGPGWAQLLTNDLGRILQGVRHMEDRLGQLESHLKLLSTALQHDAAYGSSSGSRDDTGDLEDVHSRNRRFEAVASGD